MTLFRNEWYVSVYGPSSWRRGLLLQSVSSQPNHWLLFRLVVQYYTLQLCRYVDSPVLLPTWRLWWQPHCPPANKNSTYCEFLCDCQTNNHKSRVMGTRVWPATQLHGWVMQKSATSIGCLRLLTWSRKRIYSYVWLLTSQYRHRLPASCVHTQTLQCVTLESLQSVTLQSVTLWCDDAVHSLGQYERRVI